MPLYTADALVLRTYKLGEADRIVVFLTRDRGKKRGVAKGARRPRSRFAGALEPLTEVRVAYFEKERRELVGLNYAETVRSPLAVVGPAAAGSTIIRPWTRSATSSYFAELLDEWAQDADADERLYRLGASMLDALAAGRAGGAAGALLRVLAAAAAGRVSGGAGHAVGRRRWRFWRRRAAWRRTAWATCRPSAACSGSWRTCIARSSRCIWRRR